MFHSVFGASSCRDNRSRTKTRLVREKSTRYAITHCKHNATTCEATSNSILCKCIFKDILNSSAHILIVYNKNSHTTYNVYHSHKRHKHLAHTSQPFNTTKGNNTNKHRHHGTSNVWRNTKVFGKKHRHRVCLVHITNAKGCSHGCNTEEYSQRLHFKTLFKHHHRATNHSARLSFVAIFHRKKSLGILCSNAKHTSEPAPKHCPRTTKSNSSAHTDNVASAHCSSHCHHKSTKIANVTTSLATTKSHFYGRAYMTLHHTCSKS